MAELKSMELRRGKSAEEWALSEERALVFTVVKRNPERAEYDAQEMHSEGEDGPEHETRTDYTMPAKPNPGLALAYLKRARENADLAMSWLVELAIGEEGYDALTDEMTGMTDGKEAVALLQGVVEKIQKVAMGGLDGPKA